MSDYFINRNQAVNALNEAQIEGTDTYKGLGLAKQIIDKLPCECRPKGEWNVVSDGYGNNAYICECSECKDTVWVYKDTDRKWNYCPNCGADMRGE